MVTLRYKLEFFDSARVIRAMDRATRRALSRAGAFIRTTAKRSIRRRKKSAAPGKPPTSHQGDLRRLIYFGFDRDAQSVVVGPTPFGKGEAPELLESGGTAVRVTKRRGKPGGARKRVVYKARPYMGPAMKKELPNLPKRWRNSLGT